MVTWPTLFFWADPKFPDSKIQWTKIFGDESYLHTIYGMLKEIKNIYITYLPNYFGQISKKHDFSFLAYDFSVSVPRETNIYQLFNHRFNWTTQSVLLKLDSWCPIWFHQLILNSLCPFYCQMWLGKLTPDY